MRPDYSTIKLCPYFFPEGGVKPPLQKVEGAPGFLEVARHSDSTREEKGSVPIFFPFFPIE
jgi:hypothetical protein